MSRGRTDSAFRRNSLNRRRFLKTAVGAAGPLFIPTHVLSDVNTPGANERIRIGVIGAGIRGKQLIGDMPAEGRVVAVCDCYEPRIDEVRKLKPDATFDAYADYRTMIDEAKLDAVIVAVPDHHHVLAAMLACQAGLDVYCEKPLSLTIGEGKRLGRNRAALPQSATGRQPAAIDGNGSLRMPVCPRRRFGKNIARRGSELARSDPGTNGLPKEPIPDGTALGSILWTDTDLDLITGGIGSRTNVSGRGGVGVAGTCGEIIQAT